jgi:hypothetical protein
MRCALVTLAGFVFASCASVETPGDRATLQLDNAVAAYIAAHRAQEGFPATKQEFAAWAAKHNLPLDLSAFMQLDWYPHKKYLQINWKTATGKRRERIAFYSYEPI